MPFRFLTYMLIIVYCLKLFSLEKYSYKLFYLKSVFFFNNGMLIIPQGNKNTLYSV